MSGLRAYTKLPTITSEQCDALENKGLIINDVTDASKKIERIGYYRLKAYMLPFRDLSDPQKPFINDAEFSDVYELYSFDEEFRNLIFSYIQKIEVGVRSIFSQFMCLEENNAFWHVDSNIFGHGNIDYSNTVSKVRNLFLSSREEFATYYKSNYYNSFCKFYSDLPPSWSCIELMSFGNMSSTIRSVSDEYIQNKKLDRMANRKLGVNKFRKLCNWIGVIHEVRNHVAHHARLFNRNYKAPDGVKQILSTNVPLVRIGERQEEQLNRIYTALAVMQQILKKLGYPAIGPDLDRLFFKYPIHARFLASMGFPANWTQEPLFR